MNGTLLMSDLHQDQGEQKREENEMPSTEQQPLDAPLGDTYSNDVQFEPSEDGDESHAFVLKKLREKLRVCEVEKKEYLDGWQRMRADFANARKEEDTRRGDLIKFASEGLVEDMLPILDSFGMAFANKEAWEKVDANWRRGVEYIYGQLFAVLESRGLAEIGVSGEKIDPRLHIAIEVVEPNSREHEDTVAETIQRGYRLHSKVIRPAKVRAFGHFEKIL
jgi:molecular chaperone GrpE